MVDMACLQSTVLGSVDIWLSTRETSSNSVLESQRTGTKCQHGLVAKHHKTEEKPQKAVALVAPQGVEAYLPLAGLVDLEQEIARLHKALAETEKEMQRSTAKLANEGFTSKAPPHVVQQERDKLADQKERRARLQDRLQALTD